MDFKFTLVILLLATPYSYANKIKPQERRNGKIFNVFQVITFPNGPCTGNNSRNGTCYTEQECTDKGGTNEGSCASGFGVCCIFSNGCGTTSAENCTYFEVSGASAGCCQAEICPCGDNICQMRLDFDTFTISGPSTNTNTVSKKRDNGGPVSQIAAEDDNSVTNYGQCLTDSFRVGNPNGPSPPTICGVNSGEHMYVESGGDCCNKLTMTLGNTAVGLSAVATRSWRIKVTQYSCNFPNLAPQGCTQYFWGSTTNSVTSYNYQSGSSIHLANQDQNICIRRERSNCRICWTTAADTDFAVSGSATADLRNPNLCCDYGAPTAMTMLGFDCVIIPFALTPDSTPTPRASAFCGNRSGLKGNTSCSTRTPFQLNFRSDKWEGVPEAQIGGAPANRGFTLIYFMDAIGCNQAAIVG